MVLAVIVCARSGSHRAPETGDGGGSMCIRPDTSKATARPSDVVAAIQRLTPSAYHEVRRLNRGYAVTAAGRSV